METRTRIFLIVVIMVLCIGSDQITKEIIRSNLPRAKPIKLVNGILSLDYVENKGGVFALE